MSGAAEERAEERAAELSDGPDSDFETAAGSDGSEVEAARSPASAAAERSPEEADEETMADLGKKGGASTLKSCFERELVENCESVVVVVEVEVEVAEVTEEVVVMEVEDETGGCGP